MIAPSLVMLIGPITCPAFLPGIGGLGSKKGALSRLCSVLHFLLVLVSVFVSGFDGLFDGLTDGYMCE